MRHGKKVMHLGRKTAHRKSMLANMACSLIEHKRINTTVTKAKALKQFVEPLITKSKNDTTHNRRLVFSALRNKYAVSELFRDISQKVGDRPGGYTRVIKLGNRMGDNASMAMIELVDFNEVYETNKPEKKNLDEVDPKRLLPLKNKHHKMKFQLQQRILRKQRVKKLTLPKKIEIESIETRIENQNFLVQLQRINLKFILFL